MVRKVLRSETTEFRYERERQPMPRLGAWRAELDRLLTANEARSGRERLTLIRVFEALRELGYAGGYCTARGCWDTRLKPTRQEPRVEAAAGERRLG